MKMYAILPDKQVSIAITQHNYVWQFYCWEVYNMFWSFNWIPNAGDPQLGENV